MRGAPTGRLCAGTVWRTTGVRSANAISTGRARSTCEQQQKQSSWSCGAAGESDCACSALHSCGTSRSAAAHVSSRQTIVWTTMCRRSARTEVQDTCLGSYSPNRPKEWALESCIVPPWSGRAPSRCCWRSRSVRSGVLTAASTRCPRGPASRPRTSRTTTNRACRVSASFRSRPSRSALVNRRGRWPSPTRQ